jgi:hypothetical protein
MRTLLQNPQWWEDALSDEGQLNFEELFSFTSDGQTDAQSGTQPVEFASLDFGDLWSRPEEFLATLRSLLSDAPDSDENDTDENDSDENDTDEDEQEGADGGDSDENDADDVADSDPDENGNGEFDALWNAVHDFFENIGDQTPPNGDHSTPPEGQVCHSNLSGFSGFFENLFELISSHKESGDYWLSS